MTGFSARAAEFSDPLGVGSPVSLALAVFAEFFCSLGLIFGITTRLVLIPLMVTMLVAVFIIHISDPFARMEKALIYLTVYTAIMITGPGKYSADALITKRIQQK
ncbi:MAG: DoxX family protein [bacterium]